MHSIRLRKRTSYRMKYSFGSDIKCTGSSICSIYPINNSLPVGILIVVHFPISVTEGVPVLSYCKVWLTCFQIIFDIPTPKTTNKVKSPSIISYFLSASRTGMNKTYSYADIWTNMLLC